MGGSGSTNHIARWKNSTTLENSNINESSGSACVSAVGVGPCVGIGIAHAAAHLHVLTALDGRTTLVKIENTGSSSAAALELKAAASDHLNDWRITAGDNSTGATGGLFVSNTSVGTAILVAPNLNVGIGIQSGTPTNLLTLLQGGGPAIADGWDVYSSRRWKTNVQPLEGALEKVEQLQGVSYERRADGKHEIGVLAEEVDQVVPEVVSHDPKTHEAQGVDYSRLAALLIEAVKSQQTEIQSQQAEIQQLKAQVGQLTSNPAGQ